MKKVYHILLIIVCSLIIISCNQKTPLSKAIELKKVAAELSRSCPQTIDFMTTLMKCEYTGPLTLTYTYMINIDTSLVDFKRLSKSITYISQYRIIKSLQEEIALRELTPTVIYKYINIKSKPLFKFSITPEMYENPNKYLKHLPNEELYEVIQQQTSIFNAKRGEYIDEETVILGGNAIFPKTIVLEYIFPELGKKDLDTDIFHNEVKKEMILHLRSGIECAFTDQEVIFKHNYYDKDTVLISSVEILPTDYKSVTTKE